MKMKIKFNLKPLSIVCFSVLLSACGGGGSSTSPLPPPSGPPANQAPTANAGDAQIVNEQTQVTLQGTGTDSDGTITGFNWSQTSGTPVSLDDTTAAATSFTSPTLTEQQILTFSFTVTDDDGATHSNDVSVTVNPVNSNPVTNAGADQTVDESTLVTLSGSASDEDGSISQYLWTQTSGAQVTLNNADTATATFTAPTSNEVALLVFSLTATDNLGAANSDTVTVTVNPVNDNPNADAGDERTVNKNSYVTLKGSGSDNDGHITDYTWQQTLGTNVTLIDADSATVKFWAPNVQTDNTLTFELAIVDDKGSTTTSSVNVLVLASDLFNDVQFADETLESCLRFYNAISSDTTTDSFTNISCGGTVEPTFEGIRDLTGLEQFTNVTRLSFFLQGIQSIMPLSKMTKLESLFIHDGYYAYSPMLVADFSPLAQLTSLQRLSLTSITQDAFTTFTAAPSLTRLSLSDGQLSDISRLSVLTNLTELDLSGNRINDITPLSALKSLRTLQLSNNQIVDIINQPGLGTQSVDFSHITTLDLSNNSVKTTESLANGNFSELTTLTL
ncbi:MAG: leucine-rich repeat domain-containing protein, partial [Psychrosphaera sp.]|nr:leucine-rich repeat domain-containing protein [Psychrosphaera sp.]